MTKSDVWSVENDAAKARLAPSITWHLKNIQDAIALERLGDAAGLVVGEIGGGASRALPLLLKAAQRYNIDPFEGDLASGIGPRNVQAQQGVTPIVGRVGGPLDWPDQSFDVLFSISVVEHVPTPALDAFLQDIRRLLKVGGRLLHLIDVYVDDEPRRDAYNRERIAILGAPFAQWLTPAGDVMTPDDFRFSCAWATNPDDEMERWNKAVPTLAARRAIAQSCALLMDGVRHT